jgi:hypothetical protein
VFDRQVLEIFLPGFFLMFIGFAWIWSFIRSRRTVRVVKLENRISAHFRKMKAGFTALMALSMCVVLVYCYLPEYYSLTAPIDLLDRPDVNVVGILVLKLSLIWIVTAQLSIDRTIYKINAGIRDWSYSRLIQYSERLLLAGLTVMFVGLFVTISSVLTIIICISGLAMFTQLRTTPVRE